MPDVKQILKKTFFKDPSSPAFWIILGFIFKGALFLGVVLNHPFHDISGIWGATQLDDSSYLVPIDNLLKHGSYTPDFRMPGYGVVYLLFRLVFTQAGACNALLITQLVFASISVYYLALTARNMIKKDSIFYLVFYSFLICSFPSFFDAYIGSESLCTSLLIFSVYFFIRHFQEQKNKYLLYAGILTTWAMFIRPAFGGIVVICSFLILLHKDKGLNTKSKHIFLFLIPFFLCEGAWSYRNFHAYKKFIPFTTTGAFYPNAAYSYVQPLFEFVQSWGGACSLTNKPPDIDWFQYHYPGMTPILHYDSLPDDIYTSAFNKDSLLQLKKMILELQNPSIDTATISIYQDKLRTKFNIYKLSVEKEKPFLYWVKAPLKMIGVMLYGPETKLYLDRGKSIPFFGKLIVAFNNSIYLILLLLGLFGIIGLISYGLKRGVFLLVVPLISLYTILIHSFMFHFFHSRFLIPVFPFFIIDSAYIIYIIYTRYFQHNLKG